MDGGPRFNVGDELVGPVRAITPQRIEWYDSAMLSAATDELTLSVETVTSCSQDSECVAPQICLPSLKCG